MTTSGARVSTDGFKNHFGPRATQYAAWRPHYPAELLDYVASVAGGTALAWDCGTGNGQAAVGLADRFNQVVATDASADMIAHAVSHPRVTYRVAQYASGLVAQSADLVTVAQALHWLDLEPFLAEARRVLRREGVLAVWCYSLFAVEPGLDELIAGFAHGTLAPFWPPERRFVDDEYRTFVLPLDELVPPRFGISESWGLSEFTRHVRTWSGTARCIAVQGEAPVEAFEASVRARWGDPALRRTVRWPIHMRIGRFGTPFPTG
jgi:SAM-dependent methyltransferase